MEKSRTEASRRGLRTAVSVLLGCVLVGALPRAGAAQGARATPPGARATPPTSPATIGVVSPRPNAAPNQEPRFRPGRSITAGRAAPGAPNVARPPNVGGPPNVGRPDHRVRNLPGPFTRFRHRGRIFYYCLGLFYVTAVNGYEVVDSPVGATVRTLPRGYETLEVGGETFYYYDGVFYAPGRRTGEYEVVLAPVGAVVDELPRDAVEVVIGGRRLYEARNVYYVSVRREDRSVWVVTVP